MSIKIQLNEMAKEIRLFKDAELYEEKIKACGHIFQRLSGPRSRLSEEGRKSRLIELLQDSDGESILLPADIYNSLRGIEKNLEEYRKFWVQERDNSLQDSENRLYNLVVSVKESASTLSAFYESIWSGWIIEQQQRFDVQDVILENQKNIYKNDKLYFGYYEKRKKLQGVISTFSYKNEV
jgi:hypothetical protein